MENPKAKSYHDANPAVLLESTCGTASGDGADSTTTLAYGDDITCTHINIANINHIQYD